MEEIEGVISGYFKVLFTSTNPKLSEEILDGIPRVITRQTNSKLIKPVTEMNIRKAVFSMHPDKAIGSYGMTPIFFQRFWNVIKKKKLTDVISSFINSGNLLKATNKTIITLIPKIESPTLVFQFRPISLCNVVYRVVAKVLSNRLQPLLKHCISPNQSAFISGRQIMDNIMIAHEFIHCLNRKRNGSNAYMALKLDMSKAYDRVEWSFETSIMEKMGFHTTWIHWIFKCMSSVSYSFNINRERRGYLKPIRRIRQGDPCPLICSYWCLMHFQTFSERVCRVTEFLVLKLPLLV